MSGKGKGGGRLGKFGGGLKMYKGALGKGKGTVDDTPIEPLYEEIINGILFQVWGVVTECPPLVSYSALSVDGNNMNQYNRGLQGACGTFNSVDNTAEEEDDCPFPATLRNLNDSTADERRRNWALIHCCSEAVQGVFPYNAAYNPRRLQQSNVCQVLQLR